MLFQTKNAPGNLKDTWVWFEDGVYYLYNMMMPRKGIYLSTSEDGIHFKEHDLVITGDDQIGSGMIWKGVHFDLDGKYFMSFTQHEHLCLVTKLAESSDLFTWNRLGPRAEFRPDARWYRVGPFDHRPSYFGPRWDDMQTIPDGNGGLYGFLTANPRDRSGFGFGRSTNGIDWEALPPPDIEWTQNDVLPWMEVAGVCCTHDRYYLAVKSSTGSQFMDEYTTRYNLPIPSGIPEISGIWILTADRPEGPWHPASRNTRMLTFDARYAHVSFGGFFDGPDGLMFNHEVRYTESGSNLGNQHLAPFKKVRTADDGSLHLTYWNGNEKLKGKGPFAIPLREQNGVPAFLSEMMDTETGAVIQGMLTFGSPGGNRAGIYVQGPDNTGWAVLVARDGTAEYGRMERETGYITDPEPVIHRQHQFPLHADFRLLLWDRFIELYIDDMLIQCYSTDADPTGRIGLFNAHGLNGQPPEVHYWGMR